MTGNNSKCN